MLNLKSPVCIGLVDLEDGEQVFGFVCDGTIASYGKDISHYGGWKKYLAELAEKE